MYMVEDSLFPVPGGRPASAPEASVRSLPARGVSQPARSSPRVLTESLLVAQASEGDASDQREEPNVAQLGEQHVIQASGWT